MQVAALELPDPYSCSRRCGRYGAVVIGAPQRYLPIVELAQRKLHGFEVVDGEPFERRLESAVRTAASWRVASPEGPALVIDAALDELTADVPALIGTLLGAYRLRADAMVVRVPHYSRDRAAPVLDALVERDIGVVVREPDLRGAELGLLAGAPIDCIELPAALVDHLDRDASALHRLGQRIALAHAHDWLTLARGLDRLSQVDALVELGCELASGPAVGPLLGRSDADRVVARYFPGPIARSRRLAS